MSIPILKVDLAPRPSLWQRWHRPIGWILLTLGGGALLGALALTWFAYREAVAQGRDAVLRSHEALQVVEKQNAILDSLRAIDVEKEMPAWRLVEQILEERSMPWSRLIAELERNLVQDVRLKSIQRNRNSVHLVELKVSGEAKSRASEEAFITGLQKNACFTQVILEREAERQGGGFEFDLTLPASQEPPPYTALPKYGPMPVPRTPAVSPASASPHAPVVTPSGLPKGQGPIRQPRPQVGQDSLGKAKQP